MLTLKLCQMLHGELLKYEEACWSSTKRGNTNWNTCRNLLESIIFCSQSMIHKLIQAHLVSLSCHHLQVIQDAVTNLKSKCKTSFEMGPIYRTIGQGYLKPKQQACAGLCRGCCEVIKVVPDQTVQNWVMGFAATYSWHSYVNNQFGIQFSNVYIHTVKPIYSLTWIKSRRPSPLLQYPVFGECCESNTHAVKSDRWRAFLETLW